MNPVGIVGAGTMGLSAARRLKEAGHALVVYDPSPKAQAGARALGAEVVASPAAVAAACELALMFLPMPPQVDACVQGPDGLLAQARPGLVIVDLSTVDPDTSRRQAAACRAQGVGYLDAPVLGRPAGVGKWCLPVGGRAEDLAKARPVLEKLAARLPHVGDSGAGDVIKLLNNLMFSAINTMCAEIMAIAGHVGVEPKLLYETITASQAATVSNLFIELGKNIVADQYDDATFTVDLLSKDVRLAVQMASEHGAPPVLARTIQAVTELAQVQGYGAKDTAVVWKAYQQMWEKRRG